MTSWLEAVCFLGMGLGVLNRKEWMGRQWEPACWRNSFAQFILITVLDSLILTLEPLLGGPLWQLILHYLACLQDLWSARCFFFFFSVSIKVSWLLCLMSLQICHRSNIPCKQKEAAPVFISNLATHASAFLPIIPFCRL